jgi:rRNA-processing protein FCF1
MKQIVVNDTNIFIDLYKVGLLDAFFHLPWEVRTTDFVMLELQREDQRDTVLCFKEDGVLHVVQFEFEEIVEIDYLKRRFSEKANVSLTDCSVWYYAKQNGYIMHTGDRKLRHSAIRDGVDVKGILYVFDMLVETETIPLETAYEKLDSLSVINPRLPKEEIEKRLTKWRVEHEKKGGCL